MGKTTRLLLTESGFGGQTRSAMQKNRLVIIDGNAIVHRAYHALPPMTTKDGRLVNAVYGFSSMLLKVLNDLKPTHMAVSFDVAGKTFRDDLYDKYKATRVKADQDLYDQIPLCYKVVEAFGIPIYTKEGYEADDVIGTIAKVKSQKSKVLNDVEVIIVTGDKDMLQLVEDKRVEVYLLKKGMSEFDLYDEKKVIERFGFGPKNIVDYKAFRGDSSDNIPGIKGIGEKTALEIVQKIGGIDEVYTTVNSQQSTDNSLLKPSVLKKIEEGEKDARMSYALAKIETDVPGIDFELSDAAVKQGEPKDAKRLFQQLEFFSLVKRIQGQDKEPQRQESQKYPRPKRIAVTLVDGKNIGEFLKTMKKAKVYACKEVLSGTNVLDSTLVGLVFATTWEQFYLELAKCDGKHEEIFGIFQQKDTCLVGHDLKQLVKALLLKGVAIPHTIFDIMVASYVVNSSTRAHDLASIMSRELGKEIPVEGAQATLFGADPSVVAQELGDMITLYTTYVALLEKQENLGLFEKIEMPLIPVLAQMELYGVAIDEARLKALSLKVAKAIDVVTKKIWKEAGEEFNVASSVQLRDILFDKMHLPRQGIKKGKTGLSTAASELEKMREMHPIIVHIEEHRELAKLQNTYIAVLPTLVNTRTGRIHTTFNQAVASTGRLSSSDPNLQNIPIRTKLGREIRDAFVAQQGSVLVVADYSQIELRIVASLAEDKKMIEIFERGEDIHRATAAAINNVPLRAVTKEMRSAAKEVNFGVLYGMGAYGLAWRAGIAQGRAKAFIEKYFEEFYGVKAYIDATLAFAKKEGYVETLFGRRRYIPELTSSNFQLRSAAERMAVNMPIQGTAADVMKLAMIEVHKKILNLKSKIINQNDVKMILQVHDELVLEVKKGLEDDVAKMVKSTMEKVTKLRVPVEVHVATGKRWGALK